MWIKLSQNTSCTNEKLWLGDLETDLETDLDTWLGDWPGDLAKWLQWGHTVLKFLWGRVVRGLKRGVFYTLKNTASVAQNLEEEEFVTEKGRQLFHARAMNRDACCLQLGQLTGANWNHPLASGFTWERRLLHPTTALRPSTNELLTELKTLIFSTSKLTKTISPTVWLKLNVDFFFFKGSVTRCTLIEELFSTIVHSLK